VKPAARYLAAGGVVGGLVALGLGAWRLLTNDIHTLKDIEPDALPVAPSLGKTGWKGVDKILDKLASAASSTGIPLGLMVGWIGKESAGRLADKTSLDERGYFQLMPAESKTIGVDHERLSTDSDYSIDAGVKLIRRYQSLVDKLGVAPAGSVYYWKLVKLAHSMGSGQTPKIVNLAKAAGQAGSWERLTTFALDLKINGPQPKKWFPFIDKIYAAGRPFGFGTETNTSAPSLVGASDVGCCGFDILGVDA
jgi:hypothetical protein